MAVSADRTVDISLTVEPQSFDFEEGRVMFEIETIYRALVSAEGAQDMGSVNAAKSVPRNRSASHNENRSYHACASKTLTKSG
ncbi:MAG: hypothetical protein JWS10_3445 [Cypionkella sp.]|uniref:hypothetical protein n=1 Tax=Cypionkella sp. TaxID=2811411 RepID=UPI00260221DF|nr:hypothetical protein [Cypionkella sp.]MDB5660830.1 hypothetical protein [Cypionkella sp.]